MTLKQVSLINKKRKAVQALMVKNAKAYAASSQKLVEAMEKLPAESLAVFLRKNPDVLLDIGGNVAARVGAKVQRSAKVLMKEWQAELSAAGKKGAKKAGELGIQLEQKGLEYLRKASR